jgi:acyl carrier protein
MTKQEEALDVIAKVSGKDRAALKPEAELTADLGIDSPKGLQLLMELEEKLGLEISDEEAQRIQTVGDVLGMVAKK